MSLASSDFHVFAYTYSLVFLAELPDKTALTTLLLATRFPPGSVFLGVSLAFVFQTIFAVVLGKFLGLLSPHWIELVTAILFLVFSIMLWREEKESQGTQKNFGKGNLSFRKVVWISFSLLFISEWGDFTQLATVALVAQTSRPWVVGIAAVLALWSVSGLAILLGNRFKTWINPKLIQKIAAALFFLVSVILFGRILFRLNLV